MIRPLEETDPELAAQLQRIVSGKHETIKALYQHGDDFIFVPKQIKTNKIGRNDPCPCGSGKKAKKCCGILQ